MISIQHQDWLCVIEYKLKKREGRERVRVLPPPTKPFHIEMKSRQRVDPNSEVV